MYEYKITVILKSGEILKGLHNTDVANSLDVAKELIPESGPNILTALRSVNEKEVVLFVTGEVAAIKIGW